MFPVDAKSLHREDDDSNIAEFHLLRTEPVVYHYRSASLWFRLPQEVRCLFILALRLLHRHQLAGRVTRLQASRVKQRVVSSPSLYLSSLNVFSEGSDADGTTKQSNLFIKLKW